MKPIKFQLNPTRFGRRCRLNTFKMAAIAILNLHVAPVYPTKFQLNATYDSGGDVENVKS